MVINEVLFRAKKCSDNKWVYGDLARATRSIDGRKPHASWIVNGYFSNGGWLTPLRRYAVISSTVGRYIGLKDVHGEEIFEGDIVRLVYDTTNLIVVFLEFSWQLRHPNYEFYRRRIEQNDNNRLEVIGNIYDNPELLEKENENNERTDN